jgi:hypothetical protein
MLYGEIIAVCFEIRTEQTNISCGQNMELLDSKPAGTHSTHSTPACLPAVITRQ